MNLYGNQHTYMCTCTSAHVKKPNACTSMCVWFWGILLQDVVPADGIPEEEGVLSDDGESDHADHGNVDPGVYVDGSDGISMDSSGGVLPNHTKCVDLVFIKITSRERA